ncbi:MAG: 3D-(3,5/4)-trihydroxycyclohexane-1,2-dione acylhydrolase (decyclizing) [Deltaproteobacteria bacterium]|nr:3D-(3,5/4)-trihydroxycyclohexane-1,2-dione acylhydrolase (decyclizing) [Deltaproteobacteria bacterium]
MTPTIRLTTAQALIAYLKCQEVERDGLRTPFFAGCFGIFGHGNLAGIGEALQENPGFRYYQARNEQAMVHAAVAYARMRNRMAAFACTSSIGPGATNMVTGAAVATINRLPVLLLPGDVFARRNVAPVLQQLESEQTQDISVNDCFRPVSRYWDRINRPEMLIWALPEVMRVLTSPAQTGAATLCLPQDVQAEAFDFPAGLFAPRTWSIPRPRADARSVAAAAAMIRESRRPLILAGGGVIYSDATEILGRLAGRTGIPVAETQAGKGSLPWDHSCNLGAIGVTGSPAANLVARDADLVIGVGTRYSDFTTASKTAFQAPGVRFVNVNVAEFDAAKHAGLALTGDARAVLEELEPALAGYAVAAGFASRVQELRHAWQAEADRSRGGTGGPLLTQAEVLAALNDFAGDRGVVVNAAGSAPGDLHKLWRTRDPKSYHVEYGYSCMGYEIAGGLGVKLAAPDREVFVVVGDGSYLMMSQELVTAVQEGVKLTVLLIDNHGFASIGGLSTSLGSGGFGTEYRFRSEDGGLSGGHLPIDFVRNAESLGVAARGADDLGTLKEALAAARASQQSTVIVVRTDRDARVPGYESWWDVPVAEVSTLESVRTSRCRYEQNLLRERCFHGEEKE